MLRPLRLSTPWRSYGWMACIALAACRTEPADETPVESVVDLDGDGASEDVDCDDTDASAAPGLEESCDGIDNDCDGQIDETGALGEVRWYVDRDRDGWGRDATEYEVACDAPVEGSYADLAGDCDDTDASANDGAMERCDDLVDNDCDGEINEADTNTDPDTLGAWYVDSDGDGFGDLAQESLGCAIPDDGQVWVTSSSDCDDSDADTHPGAAEHESVDLCTRDRDGDGWGDDASGRPYQAGSDCDDTVATVYPDAVEACDGVDSDCAGGLSSEEEDVDGDRWVACTVLEGEWLGDPAIRGGDDCAPADATRHPGADETCDGEDDDCDGVVDEDDAVDAVLHSLDTDGDGYGDGTTLVTACDAPSGYVELSSGPVVDCDDTDDTVFPGADESCNSIDDDCDGTIDEDGAIDATTFYVDADGDGYGSIVVAAVACAQPSGGAALSTDCDDGDAGVNPGATELCSGVDEDCDGLVDDADPDVTVTDPWYLDGDGDGYGDPASPLSVCTGPSGFVADDSDCDDGNGGINPGATEVCRNGEDDDCDGTSTGCEAEGTFTLTSADAQVEGTAGLVEVGAAVSMADVNGDGQADLLLGATGARSGGLAVGGAFVLFGPVTGALDTDDADVALTGDSLGEAVGASLAGGGDLDQDGTNDLVVGSCAPPSAVDSAGRAFVFLGPVTASADVADADYTLSGVDQDDALGCVVASAGDLNNDTEADLLVGIPGDDDGGIDAGGVYLYAGPLSAGAFASSVWLEGESLRDEAGRSAVSDLDLNGDGVGDLVVGAPGRSNDGGAAYVLLGPTTISSDLSIADARLSGQLTGDAAGTALATPGDLDGDGLDDLLIGAPGQDSGATDGGAVYLVLGSSGTWQDLGLAFADGRVAGTSADGALGTSVSGAGDTDADGVLEFVAGAPYAERSGVAVGGVWRMVGPVSGTHTVSVAAASWMGKAVDDAAGTAVFGGVDLEADGFSDIVVGAPGLDQFTFGLSDVGGAYLVRGTGL